MEQARRRNSEQQTDLKDIEILLGAAASISSSPLSSLPDFVPPARYFRQSGKSTSAFAKNERSWK